ncbi:MAG: HAMP domain-containing histidine kinase [bacterium]|nr:HAMP domain-containing histidine kinase [bacterium]
MTTTANMRLTALTARLQALSDGRPTPAVSSAVSDAAEADPDPGRIDAESLAALVSAAERLADDVESLSTFSAALAKGNLDFTPPPRVPLLGPLKALQSSLRHLTWQTREVASGHLEHRIDFLGEFSVAFNSMIDSLRAKRQAESEALHATRQAGIGQVASATAHEINSVVQYIVSNLQFLADVLPPLTEAADVEAADIQAALAETLEGAERIGLTVTALREFSNTEGSATTDLNRAVTNTLLVARHTCQAVGEVDLHLQPGLPVVAGHAADVCQVVLQLLTNADRAVAGPDRPEPARITVATRRHGKFVRLRVVDNGCGIPAAWREQVFELFFSAWPNAVGRGLGLPICRDIVTNRLGGSLAINDALGGGTMVTVDLRCAG